MAKKRQRDVTQIPAAEADVQNRLLANQLRAMEMPAVLCSSLDRKSTSENIIVQHYDRHQPSPLSIVTWTIAGVPPDNGCAWFCDACELGMTDEQRNGQCCPKCGRHVEPAAERPRLVVAVRPCVRCGVVYLDKQHT